MKKIYTLLLLLSITCVSFAQERKETKGSSDENVADVPRAAIDTIDTRDKFTKIILFEDHTWEYFDMGKPVINDSTFFEGWDTGSIHAFKDVPMEALPEEVDLALVDSLHNYYPPFIGKVRSSFKFRGSREHKGTDIPLSVGDTIRAAFDGVVRVIESTRNSGGYGNMVVLRHPNGLETYYGHLSKFLVDSTEIVKAGEVIGLGGNTGRSTGPHLHFEVRYMGKPFDPERIIDFQTGALRDSLFCLKKHYFNIYSHYGQSDEESVAASQRIIHVIKSGDMLGKLAVKYNTTVSKICQLNGISSKTILRTGRRLIVR